MTWSSSVRFDLLCRQRSFRYLTPWDGLAMLSKGYVERFGIHVDLGNISMYTINAFEWDNEKAWQNAFKHGITFQEAADSFLDPQRLIIEDITHSEHER